MYAQILLLNPVFSAKTIRHEGMSFQNAMDYAQETDRDILFVEGIQQTDFDAVMSIDASTNDDHMRQQGLAITTCHKGGQKHHYRKDCPNSAGTSSGPDQNIHM